MKIHIITTFAFAAAAVSAMAGTATSLDVKAPFAFEVGASQLPAGEYTVTDEGNGFLLFRGTKTSAFVPRAVLNFGAAESDKPTFLFREKSGKYVLGEIRPGK